MDFGFSKEGPLAALSLLVCVGWSLCFVLDYLGLLWTDPQGLGFVFPLNRVGNTFEVSAEDLNRIEAEEFLNDTVIDFYLM